MKYLAFVVIFGCIQGLVLAVPTSAPPSPSALEDVISRAQVALGNMTQEVSKVLGVTDITDGQKVLNSLVSGTENLAKKVGAIVSDLQKEVSTHSGDINGILKSVTTRLNQTLQDLQSPEMQAKAVQVQHQLESGLQTLISESRKLANAAVSGLSNSQPDLTKITTKALEDVIDTAAKVQEKVKAAIANAAPST